MVRHRSNRKSWGVGLAEALTVMMVLTIVGGTLVAIYQASIRTYARGATENYAQQKAVSVVQRLAPDLRQAWNVQPGDPPYDSYYLTVYLPDRQFDSDAGMHLNHISTNAEGRPVLDHGNMAIYYRGNADAALAAHGDRIWRTLLASDGVTTLKQDVLADHVVDNPNDAAGTPAPLFRYWPDEERTSSVTVTVTVRERGAEHYYRRVNSQSTMNAEFSLRNNR